MDGGFNSEAMRASTGIFMQTSGRAVTCGGICAAGNHAASAMQAGRNGVAPSATGSALMNGQRSLNSEVVLVIGKATP